MGRLWMGWILLGCLTQEKRAEQFHAEAKAWLATVEKADVTFYKLHPKFLDGAQEGAFHRYRILDQKPVADAKVVESLRSILADPKVYGEDTWGCFSPGMGFRFKAGAQESDLVICLKCCRIVMTRGGESRYWELSEEGSAQLLRVYDDIVTKQVRFAEEAASLLTGLEKAEITFYRLDPNVRGREVKGEAFHGYPVLDKKQYQGEPELRALLTDPKSYGKLPAACFDPGMGFLIKGEKVEVDLVICLDCQRVVADRGETSHQWVLSDVGNDRLRKIYDAQK